MKPFAVVLLALALSACSSMPELTVPYYLPKASTEVNVTQTASCTQNNTPVVATDVRFSSSYSRDVQKEFDYGQMGSGLAKASVTMQFYGDGRIKGLNTETTSQFGEALPVILSLLPLPDFGMQMFNVDMVPSACDLLMTADGKPLTLTVIRRGFTSFDSETGQIDMQSLTVPESDLAPLLAIFGTLKVNYAIGNSASNPADANTEPSECETDSAVAGSAPTLGDYDGPSLCLREPAKATITVELLREGEPVKYSGSAWVPQHGSFYQLPVQKSAWFGNNSMELDLSEAGRITKLKYGTGGAATGALNATQALRDSVAGESASDEALRLKAESDLIFEQQRLVKCQADPASCTK